MTKDKLKQILYEYRIPLADALADRLIEEFKKEITINSELNKKLKVLSLFDGISCGMVALERANIPVERYVAYEIDENAIKCSEFNYPQIEHKGSVVDADFSQYEGFDLLIGGSPCQDLCNMGNKQGLEGEKSKLFYEYLRALKEVKPKYFLLENNASMTDKNKNIISELMGCDPVMIDSANFSAQTRKRYYWTNITISDIPDKNIYLKDIIDMSDDNRENVSEQVQKYVFSGQYDGRKINKTVKNSIRELNQKSRTIGCHAYDIASNTGITINGGGGLYIKPTQAEFEALQTLPKGFTSCLPIKKAVFAIGNGWTVDVIAHIFNGLKKDFRNG